MYRKRRASATFAKRILPQGVYNKLNAYRIHMGPKWPRPQVTLSEEPRFLFIVTPPLSGSTALAQILNSSGRTVKLTENAEGQWLLPGMCGKDRWKPSTVMQWDSVRAVWLSRYQLLKSEHPDVELIIEKSPANTVRFDQLVATFPNYAAISFNRNPYANCASAIGHSIERNEHKNKQRKELVGQSTEAWLMRSRWIRKWRELYKLDYITYEGFCADPASSVSRLVETEPALSSIDVNHQFTVKEYDVQGIVNYNDVQISTLSDEDIDTIREVLQTDLELVDYMGYSLDPSVSS